jgi:cell division protein FtsZ
LLISITGGRDLKLYEVDEAATRIREEVDSDANIIVGATFDESLDGIIRVSVVATGIDQAHAQKQTLPQAEQRIAEVAHRLRGDNLRISERPERAEPMQQQLRPAAAAPVTAPTSVNASIASVAKAAIAAAIMPQGSDDVAIRPLAPKPSLFIDPPASDAEAREPEAFIPPQPERAAVRTPRMPRIDELPVPAQNEIRARRGELPPAEHPEGQRKSLLQRLASVGLGRRQHEEEDAEASPRNAPPSLPQSPERLAGRPMPRVAEARPEPVSEYAKRPAPQGAPQGTPQGLDQHGRQTPVHNQSEEDQLDIPAFLRRQAN